MTTEQRRPGENQGGAGDLGGSGGEGSSAFPSYPHVETAMPLIVALLGRLVAASERSAAAQELRACQLDERLDAIAVALDHIDTGIRMPSWARG